MSISIKKIVKTNLCLGCGLCTVDPQIKETKFSSRNDCYIPSTLPKTECLGSIVCPGKGYPIIEAGKEFFPKSIYNHFLGRFDFLTAAHSTRQAVLENASSGGVITDILLYLLEAKIVDKVSVTQFKCDHQGVHTETFLTDKTEEVLRAQGSKYCPVDFSHLIKELTKYTGRVAIMATPCTIAGIRNIQKKSPELIKCKIVLTIANFCGGFKSFRDIKRLADICNVDYYNLKDFRFRGDGQPGGLRFIEKSGRMVKLPYPYYSGLTGYSKMHRCFSCVDGTGELADIACGDAWIPRFQNKSTPWSMIICRSIESTEIIKKMQDSSYLELEEVTAEEIVRSQFGNLDSKKTRQRARMSIYRFLGYHLPIFDGGYGTEMTSRKLEIKVFLSHKIELLAEKLGLYTRFYVNNK